MAENDVFDIGKSQKAIKAALDLFADMDMTIAESIHAVYVLDSVLKSMYPDAHRLVTGKK